MLMLMLYRSRKEGRKDGWMDGGASHHIILARICEDVGLDKEMGSRREA